MVTSVPVDPLEGPRYILSGRIVTMNARREVINDGVVCIDKGSIVAAQPKSAPLPPNFAVAPLLDTQGTIYPGLIDLHNHLSYNVLPLWQVPHAFGNRGQWSSHVEKKRLISRPMEILARTPGQIEAIVRYAEAKCLVNGVTTSQGLTLVNDAGIVKRYRGIVRNVEQTDDDALPEAGSRIPDVKDAAAFLRRLKSKATIFLHLCEGVDTTARKQFAKLQLNGGWAINKALAGIHCCGLVDSDYDTLAENGGQLVWSPLSNLLLYGKTVDIARAKQAGLTIAMGPDWSPSGSKSLLGELKVAWLVSNEAGSVFSARELVEMATINAARTLKWDAALGSLEVGKRADLMVLNGTNGTNGDPYEHLLRAKDTDVELVAVNGMPRFGLRRYVEPFETLLETVMIGGERRVLNLIQTTADPLVGLVTLAQARARLTDAMSRLPELANGLARTASKGHAFGISTPRVRGTWMLLLDNEPRADTTLRALTDKPRINAFNARTAAKEVPPSIALDALTVADDPGYLNRIAAQVNLPDFVKTGLPTLFA